MSVRWAEWNCRSPHGERGLKFLVETVEHILRESLSSRRAWIEIIVTDDGFQVFESRSPHGERGLK